MKSTPGLSWYKLLSSQNIHTLILIYQMTFYFFCIFSIRMVTTQSKKFVKHFNLQLEEMLTLKYLQNLTYQFFIRKKSQERKVAEDFGQSKFGRLRKFLWNMTEYPETSKAAQVSIFRNFTSTYNFNSYKFGHLTKTCFQSPY